MTAPQPQNQPKQLALFEHSGQPVFVLIPVDGLESRWVREQIMEKFDRCEKVPSVVEQLRLGRLPTNAIVYVAHKTKARVKKADGRFSEEPKLHISDPLPVSSFLFGGFDADGLGGIDVRRLTDSLDNSCLRTGTPRFSVRLSAEKDLAMKTAKMFTT